MEEGMKRYLMLAILLLAMISFGCAKKPATPAPEPPQEIKAEQPAPIIAPAPASKPQPLISDQPSARDIYERNYAMLPTAHTVVKGECLWWIAEYKEIYNDPFMWPLIFKANRDQISNPDLIYPNQVFQIPRAYNVDDLKDGRKMAGAPRPYLPPHAANLPADIRAELGWGF
jgi:hypothetical protein